MDIGYWLRQTRKNNNRQFWIEAYTCALQRVAEASGDTNADLDGIRRDIVRKLDEVAT